MQMVGILVGNTLCYFEVYTKIPFIIDYFVGNTIFTTIFLIVCSFVFKFCNWHRFIICSNFISITIAEYDILIGIPITDKQLLLSYYIVATIFSLIAIYSKFHCHVKPKEITN